MYMPQPTVATQETYQPVNGAFGDMEDLSSPFEENSMIQSDFPAGAMVPAASAMVPVAAPVPEKQKSALAASYEKTKAEDVEAYTVMTTSITDVLVCNIFKQIIFFFCLLFADQKIHKNRRSPRKSMNGTVLSFFTSKLSQSTTP